MRELWDRLGEVRSGRLAVQERDGTREGSGAVTVHRPDPSTIVWEEAGRWHDAEGRPTTYRDRLHWRRTDDPGILALHHARRGDDLPVHLGDLALAPDGAWRSLAPHLCGADQYDVVVTRIDGEVTLVWRVQGPRKDYVMVRRYS